MEELSDAQRPGRSGSPAAQPEPTEPEQPHNAAPQPATDKATIESAERAQTVRGTSQTADYSHGASQEVTLAEFVQAVQRRALAQAEPQMDAPAASDAEAEAEQVTPTAQPRAVGVTDGSAPAPISVEFFFTFHKILEIYNNYNVMCPFGAA